MVNVWKFDSISESNGILNFNCDDSDSVLKFQTFAICSYCITQWAVKSLILANPL